MEKLDRKLIQDFRNRINEDDLILHIYRNHNGRNKWSVICAAMDWIEVCVDGIDLSLLELGNTNKASISFLTFIMCIDVMWEGVQQLHRVFFDTTRIPFDNNNDIFKQKSYDNLFWKEIRAAFAVHPTNLKGEGDERRFASWSGFLFGVFRINIYSSDPTKSPIESFEISLSNLMDFAASRYKYLQIILDKIDDVKKEYCDNYRKQLIRPFTEDTEEVIDILIEENKKRLENDFYNYRLLEMKKAFSITPDNHKNASLLQEYKKALLTELKQLYNILQNMDLNNNYTEIDDSADPEYVYPNQHIFEPEKGLVEWAIERLKVPLGTYIDFDAIRHIDELQVLVRAGWWKKRADE